MISTHNKGHDHIQIKPYKHLDGDLPEPDQISKELQFIDSPLNIPDCLKLSLVGLLVIHRRNQSFTLLSLPSPKVSSGVLGRSPETWFHGKFVLN